MRCGYLLVVDVVQRGGELLQHLVQAVVQTPPDVTRHAAPAPPREPAPPATVDRDEGGVHWGCPYSTTAVFNIFQYL